MSRHDVELVYLDGCPHAGRARENLRAALDGGAWREWNLSAPDVPERLQGFGSPTVLVNGKDVTGGSADAAAMACRADGAPSPRVIREALG